MEELALHGWPGRKCISHTGRLQEQGDLEKVWLVLDRPAGGSEPYHYVAEQSNESTESSMDLIACDPERSGLPGTESYFLRFLKLSV